MNRFRQLCATTLLTLVLAASPALAGDMPFGITGPPPPPPPENSVAGEMPGPGVTSQASSTNASATGDMPTGITAIDPLTELTLGLLQGVFSLF
ncbi:MAG: hypothetical protein QOJ64_4421 [Acidobacteriota bacterium]|jgi:hypothetical protein|nr:hypothetical protein [Acidobacteriota bacterium]